jgi:hypothetical protein
MRDRMHTVVSTAVCCESSDPDYKSISGKVIHRIRLAHILFSMCLTITARELGKDDGKEVIAARCWLKPAFAEVPSRVQTAPITSKNTILRRR